MKTLLCRKPFVLSVFCLAVVCAVVMSALLSPKSAWSKVKPHTSPPITLSIPASESVYEGSSGLHTVPVKVTLLGNSDQAVSVHYAVTVLKRVAPKKHRFPFFLATDKGPSKDFIYDSGTLNFPPGQKSETIFVKIIGDKHPEFNQVFLVEIDNATNATIINPNCLFYILNDDTGPGGNITLDPDLGGASYSMRIPGDSYNPWTANSLVLGNMSSPSPLVTITLESDAQGGIVIGGTTVIDHTGILFPNGGVFTSAGGLTLNKGELTGPGDVGSAGVGGVATNVANNGGTVIPGGTLSLQLGAPKDALGKLTVHGTYTQDANSNLTIQIKNFPGGTAGSGTAGVDYDQLNVTGMVALSGMLTISPSGYTPHNGDRWPIIMAAGHTGAFLKLKRVGGNVSTTGSVGAGNGLSYTIDDHSDAKVVYLTVIPTP